MCEVGTGLVSTLVSTPRQKKEKTTKEMALKFAKELLATSTVNVTWTNKICIILNITYQLLLNNCLAF